MGVDIVEPQKQTDKKRIEEIGAGKAQKDGQDFHDCFISPPAQPVIPASRWDLALR